MIPRGRTSGAFVVALGVWPFLACQPSPRSGAAAASTSAAQLSAAISVASVRPAPGATAATSGTSGSPSLSASVQAQAVDAVPDPAPGMRPEGRGLWIWDFEKNAPPPERAAALAAKWGAARVFIKSGNGAEKSRWARNFKPQNLEPFLRRGIEVWGFGYFYAGNAPDADGRRWGTLEAQVEATANVTLQPGVTGLVVDAEIELEGKHAEAKKLCALLRARLPTLKIAYTTFGWLAPHKNFPFEELDAGCGDAFLPQVYWAFGWPGGVTDSLARLKRDLAARSLNAPVWPVQSNERDPSAADLNHFFRLAGPNASIFYLHPEDTPQTKRLGAVHFRGAPSAGTALAK